MSKLTVTLIDPAQVDNPPAGKVTYFTDINDGLYKYKDETGTVVTVGGGAAPSVVFATAESTTVFDIIGGGAFTFFTFDNLVENEGGFSIGPNGGLIMPTNGIYEMSGCIAAKNTTNGTKAHLNAIFQADFFGTINFTQYAELFEDPLLTGGSSNNWQSIDMPSTTMTLAAGEEVQPIVLLQQSVGGTPVINSAGFGASSMVIKLIKPL